MRGGRAFSANFIWIPGRRSALASLARNDDHSFNEQTKKPAALSNRRFPWKFLLEKKKLTSFR
jgi:hypothetical protein